MVSSFFGKRVRKYQFIRFEWKQEIRKEPRTEIEIERNSAIDVEILNNITIS